jgi:asparagine synthetase B (glutamine-hydrolysing)
VCGLFGIMTHGNVVGLEVENLRTLGLIASLRGRDSTGVLLAAGNKYMGVRQGIMKDPIDSPAFLYSYEFDKAIVEMKPFLIAGHCRDATIGEVNEANAHPFRHKHIRGMHNGTVHKLAPPKEMAHEYTDSRVIIESIADVGLSKTLEDCKDGAYALVYTNSNDHTLNFIRNDKRTLYWVKTKSGCLYWASEYSMLKFMMSRSGSQFEDIMTLPTGTLLSFKLGESALKPVFTPIVKDKFFENEDEWESRYDPILQKTTYKKKHSKFKTTSVPSVIQLPAVNDDTIAPWEEDLADHLAQVEDKDNPKVYKGYRAQEYTFTETMKLLGAGCGNCGTVVGIDDKAHFFNHAQYLCNDCHVGDDFMLAYGPKDFVEGEKIK